MGRDKNSGVQIGGGCLSLTGQAPGLAGTQRLNVRYRGPYLQGESRAESHMIGKHLTELVLK